MNTRRKLLIATAIHLGWRQMRSLLKAHEPFNQPGRSADHQTATNAFELVALLVRSNLHQDLIAPPRLQRKLG